MFAPWVAEQFIVHNSFNLGHHLTTGSSNQRISAETSADHLSFSPWHRPQLLNLFLRQEIMSIKLALSPQFHLASTLCYRIRTINGMKFILGQRQLRSTVVHGASRLNPH
eukprot:TRINITY_DN10442_c0_g1_i4.p1 TRINITY_DN10442_c0_g1~~TRINITY_DN10442_c0_g1_i4.p1  ORF type:complete len:110 (-),score=11.20 TRINITY_DN10442_c0_g1_i4:97-426(-)